MSLEVEVSGKFAQGCPSCMLHQAHKGDTNRKSSDDDSDLLLRPTRLSAIWVPFLRFFSARFLPSAIAAAFRAMQRLRVSFRRWAGGPADVSVPRGHLAPGSDARGQRDVDVSSLIVVNLSGLEICVAGF